MKVSHLTTYFWQTIGILAFGLGIVGYTNAIVSPGVLIVVGMSWLQIGILHARVDNLADKAVR